MKYVLSIDWLYLFCMNERDTSFEPKESERFRVKREPFGTRCFSTFHRVQIANAEGGWDEFAELQSIPYSSILPPDAVMVRFVNRSLYMQNFWSLAEELMQLNWLSYRGISRIDICADFNDFATISPKALIEQFAAKRLRHIGRGVGALYFDHRVVNKEYGVNYTGLSFGTHASGAHVYLYNKSFELLTQGDKPWIRDTWKNAGLDVRNVWRLEVSIKSEGLKFKRKDTGEEKTIEILDAYDKKELCKIYHTFIKKLFAFIRNKEHISNITREPRIILFDDEPVYDRGAIRNLSAGNRMERILIKSLYQLADRYRGERIWIDKEKAQYFAESLAASTGLNEWLQDKKEQWETPIHK